MRNSYYFFFLILAVAVAAFLFPALDVPIPGFLNWGIIAAVLAVLICIALFFEFESAATSSKEIALIAMLGTISAVLRVPFAAVPSVQPCTYLIMCSGYVLGPVAGFTVGATTALVSNFFLGQGPWTPYQMVAWGLAGLTMGFLTRLPLNRFLLIVIGIFWGYMYGLITNLWFWTEFIYPLTLKTLLVTELNAIWFDTLHALGNAIFLGLLGTKTIHLLKRFKRRFAIKIVRQAQPVDNSGRFSRVP